MSDVTSTLQVGVTYETDYAVLELNTQVETFRNIFHVTKVFALLRSGSRSYM